MMKKLLCFPAGLFMVLIPAINVFSQPLNVNSSITEVTVFLNGAQVLREGSIMLEPGTQELLFGGLPVGINPQSIQAGGTGNFSILSVNHQINYLKSPAESRQMKLLQDSLRLLQNMVNLKKSALSVCDEEEAFLKANRSIGGNNTGVNVSDLKTAAEFIRNRFSETGKLRISLTKEINELNEQIARIQNQLNNFNKPSQPTSEILIKVSAEQKTKALIRLSYMTNNASWTPEYDLRATDPTKPVELVYKGSVIQNTGEDWNNIKLTLSTGNPSLGGTKPELSTWFLDFYKPRPSPSLKAAKSMVTVDEEMEDIAVSASGTREKIRAPEAITGSSLTTTSESQTMFLYTIKVPSMIPSYGKPQQVEIRKEKLEASFIHYAVPKLDPDAFLTARITGWEKLNLLPGNASLFFEETYTGQSFLNPGSAGDTLEISLGRDKGISLRRERIKEFTSRQLGSNKKDIRGFEITVRNNKKVPVNLLLQDQIPVSTNKDISVEASELSGGTLDKQSGKITWNLSLAPGELKTKRLVYEVKYPKERQIILE